VRHRRFLVLWTLAVVATTTAFVVHLALRGKTVDLGYRLGLARNEQASLRETKRVLELEVASYQTPERIERVARSLLGMTPPPPERVIPLRPRHPSEPVQGAAGRAGASDASTAVVPAATAQGTPPSGAGPTPTPAAAPAGGSEARAQ
jgi:cell division protein FtsL